MASFKNRQSSENNQSVPETGYVPETHSYQEKHFQPVMNEPVVEGTQYTEVGTTVTPDPIEMNPERHQRSDVVDQSDQPGENDLLGQQLRQNLQGNSDSGTQYSTPDVSSGVSSGSEGTFTGASSAGAAGTTAAATTTATTTVAATATTASVAATISSVAVAAAGAVVIAATLILPLFVGVPSAIIFEDISVTDTSVYYTIFFEDYEEDMELTVCLHNNFTNRTHTVESHSISILEENLKPGMEYKITVYGSMSAVLEERTVKTDKTSSGSLDVEKAEFSMSDGKIHLTASLKDPKGRWSDFKAVFYDTTDGKHTAVRSVPIDSFDSEIIMDVGLATDTSIAGVFAIECMEGGEPVTLYETEMTAYGIPYLGLSSPFSIVDDSVSLECNIIDPSSVRTDYAVALTVTNANDPGMSHELTEPLVNGRCSFTKINEDEATKQVYAFYDVTWMITCTENGVTKVVQSGSCSSYKSPELSLERSGLSIQRDTSGPTESVTLLINLEVMDKNDEWTDLKAVLSGYDGRGNLVTAEQSFTKQYTTVSVDVSGNNMSECKNCTLAIQNGEQVLRQFTGLYMTPTFKTGNVSYDSTSHTARVEILDVHDSFEEWIFSNTGEWKTDYSSFPYAEPKLSTSPTTTGTVETSSGAYTAVFEISDEANLNTSLSFMIGNTSISVVFYDYTLQSYEVVKEQSALYGKLKTYGPNNVLGSTGSLTVTFAGETQTFNAQYSQDESDVVYITFPISESQLGTPGAIVLTLNGTTIIEDTITFVYPEAVSLDYSISPQTSTGILQVDFKGLDTMTPQLVSINGATLSSFVTGEQVSGSIYSFTFGYDGYGSEITTQIVVDDKTYEITATYSHDYTLEYAYGTYAGDSYQGCLVLNGPILSGMKAYFSTGGSETEGFDGSGMTPYDSEEFTFSVDEDQLNVQGTLILEDSDGHRFHTMPATFSYIRPTVVSATFASGGSPQGDAVIILDLNGNDASEVYISNGLEADGEQAVLNTPSDGQCKFTFVMSERYATGTNQVTITVGNATGGSSVFLVEIEFVTT